MRLYGNRLVGQVIFLLSCSIGIVLAVSSPATAAGNVVYSNYVPVPEQQLKTSGIAPLITGGAAGVEGIGLTGRLEIKTFLSGPGTGSHSAIGSAPGLISLSHDPKYNYQSGCLWWIATSGPPTTDTYPLYCYYTTGSS